MFKRRGRKPKKTMVQRLFRSLVSVIILTAFVLGISLFVKEIATLDPDKAVRLTSPLWAKIGISQDTVGQVAGAFAERIFKTNIAPSQSYQEESSQEGDILPNNQDSQDIRSEDEGISQTSSQEVVLKVGFMADSQNDSKSLTEALETAKGENVDTIFFLGDFTSWGSVEELEQAKEIMENSGLIYYSLPGDHDLGQSVGPSNFNQVFGDPRRVVIISSTKFVLLNNSANKTLIEKDILDEFKDELNGAKFVVLSQPLYYDKASYYKSVMGVFEGEVIEELKAQADDILESIRNSDVRAIVSADHHSFSIGVDPVRSTLSHVVIGSITPEKAEKGVTSISVLNVYDNGSYSIQEVPF